MVAAPGDGEATASVEPLPDELLLVRTGEGDEAAFTELVERWKNPLLNFFFRSVHSVETAEDLTQRTFLRIFRAASRYEPRAKFSTYLFQVARRLLINEYRKGQRRPLDFADPADLPAVDSDASTQRVSEIEEAFALAVNDLPENQRSAILLLIQQELSYEEIADVLETTVSSVKTWIFRARQHLRSRMRDLLLEPS